MSTQVNTSHLLHRGRVFNILQDNVTLENGSCIDLEVIRHPGASAIVALTEKKEILLLKQYRYAVGGFIWEIPAGTFSGKEPPLACARRELQEETGYSANTWKKLGEITPVPGYSDERIHLFLAQDLEERVQNLDDDEVLMVQKVDYKKVLSMIDNGEIQDAKTLSALFLATRTISLET
ncbi:MAG: NUDIX hydrolase [Desulfobacteraceae bacterium]|jgi:ADP-ribose pyrophosphatase